VRPIPGRPPLSRSCASLRATGEADLREYAAATVDELRVPFDSYVHDLAELAFRESERTRVIAPPFSGKPLAAWLRELRRRRAGILATLADEQRTISAPLE